MPGKFIVFEGIDGSGKGTQLKLSFNYLWNLSKEIDIYATREPTRNNKEIRERMRKNKDVNEDINWYAKNFIEDRVNHCTEYISPALKRGIHILCDRYKYSTLAYQETQGMEFEEVLKMHEIYPQIPTPDLTMIFDCPVEIAFERRKKDGAIEVFDKDIGFQKRLRENYLKLPNRLKEEKIVIINASYTISEVFEQTKKKLDLLLGVKSDIV
ncbi:MAG TPA: dTMP kinase [Candidatus Nanoarchaeia archaeon]|nr:dTMP kinase [Candidatus Nanoarchaeia archaeon]